MKKFITSLLAVAMFASVAVCFAGCDKFSGKEYSITDAKVTIITEVNEGGSVKTTETFAIKDYALLRFKITELHKTYAEAKAYTLSAEEQKVFDVYYAEIWKEISSQHVAFKNGKFQLITRARDAVTGEGTEGVQHGTYVIDGDIATAKFADSNNGVAFIGTEYEVYKFETMEFKLDGKTIIMRVYNDNIDESTVDFTSYVNDFENQYYTEYFFTAE